MDFKLDHFALLGLPQDFRIDMALLDKHYREVLAKVHPDRFVQAGDAEKRLSLQWATQANEAYQTLKKPLARARYLLQLAGQEVGAENNTAMSTEFLVEQMEWRENVAEARAAGEQEALENLHQLLGERMHAAYEELADLFARPADYANATDRVRRLMFLEKLQHEIADAIMTLEEK